jgi:hypothetical protein
MKKPKFDKVTLPLTDSDLWGLEASIMHCKLTNYFKDSKQNQQWAENMLEKIDKARKYYRKINR